MAQRSGARLRRRRLRCVCCVSSLVPQAGLERLGSSTQWLVQWCKVPPQVGQACAVRLPVLRRATTLFSQVGQLMWPADLRVTMPLSPGAVVTEGDLNQIVRHLLHVTALFGVAGAGALQEASMPARARMNSDFMTLTVLFVLGSWLSRIRWLVRGSAI